MMLIGTRSKTNAFQNQMIVNINGSSMPLSNNIKLLGVTIDTNLTFEHHIEYIIFKVVPKIGILHRLRPILPLKALQNIYIAILQSVFDHCLTLWGNRSSMNKNINTVQKLQNRAARVITGIFYFSVPSSTIRESLGWTTIRDRYDYFFKYFHV